MKAPSDGWFRLTKPPDRGGGRAFKLSGFILDPSPLASTPSLPTSKSLLNCSMTVGGFNPFLCVPVLAITCATSRMGSKPKQAVMLDNTFRGNLHSGKLCTRLQQRLHIYRQQKHGYSIVLTSVRSGSFLPRSCGNHNCIGQSDYTAYSGENITYLVWLAHPL